MSKTFKHPLVKRTDFSFHSGVFDYKYIRENMAPNPFGIKPDPKTVIPCSMDPQCSAVYDPNTKQWSAGCRGTCQYC